MRMEHLGVWNERQQMHFGCTHAWNCFALFFTSEQAKPLGVC